MLKHIGLAAVVVALVALTADTVHARGGGRSGHWGNRSNNSAYLGHGNAVSNAQTGQTPTVPTRIMTTTNPSTNAGTNTSATTTQPTTKAGVGTAQSPAQSTVTTSPLTVSPYVSIPLSTDPNTAAQRTYGPILHNAKQLIKAGLYTPAATYLQRIITGAPGTRIAAEAQRLLAKLPI
jgi:TolA-binding protein